MGLYYGHNQSQGSTPIGLGYGYLYNRYAAQDLNMLPTNWGLPSFAEINTFIAVVGATGGAACKVAGTEFWDTANGTNINGFTAKGTGRRDSSSFNGAKTFIDIHGESVRYLRIHDNNDVLNLGIATDSFGVAIRPIYKGVGAPPTPTVTDFEGRIYNYVLIGAQYWVTENWACAFLDNGVAIPSVTDQTAWNALITKGKCAYDNDEGNV